ncbi:MULTISPECIES: hypothetical protein [Acidithrix]|uniref:Polyketide cyclase / dehydrase and lipid transport n=2 Tax=root TaxID=1 RepID=A0A0D8HJN1_9ACTN|nr:MULTISPECIES: hypothetical protein [Acidithrix]KJF18089.1 hypothetical protein AXFE_09900 [Acidithrix ferrooxidans]CAG4930166.1 unnamed protein product [Acidithrix sp. C25]
MAIEDLSGDIEEGSATFIFDFVHFEAKYEEVVSLLEVDQAKWLGVASREILEDQSFVTRVGPSGLISKQVEVYMGESRQAFGCVLLPIAWESHSAKFLFPRLEGDLEFSRVDETHVRLALRGSYRVPLGAFGEKIDKLIMHRMAESTVRSFLTGVSDEISSRLH